MALTSDPAALIRSSWSRLAPLPLGKLLFTRLLGVIAPYSGTTRARVEELGPGYARVVMRDRRRVRNHLRSVHAMALCNLGELSTGLALLFGMPPGGRGILTGFSIEYLKKARGTLTATCRCELPSSTESREYEIHGDIADATGTVVARAHARWRVGPSERPQQPS